MVPNLLKILIQIYLPRIKVQVQKIQKSMIIVYLILKNNNNKNQENHLNINKDVKILEESKNKENSYKNTYNIKKNDNNNKNKIPKGYIDHLNLNCFNRLCEGKFSRKRKTVQLFNLSSIFYRKRMDIVTCFSRSFLIEKLLLKDNLNTSYGLCKEIEL